MTEVLNTVQAAQTANPYIKQGMAILNDPNKSDQQKIEELDRLMLTGQRSLLKELEADPQTFRASANFARAMRKLLNDAKACAVEAQHAPQKPMAAPRSDPKPITNNKPQAGSQRTKPYPAGGNTKPPSNTNQASNSGGDPPYYDGMPTS